MLSLRVLLGVLSSLPEDPVARAGRAQMPPWAAAGLSSTAWGSLPPLPGPLPLPPSLKPSKLLFL